MPTGDDTYTPELAATICQRLAEGETLRAICRTEGMPWHSTILRWALDDVHGFAHQYARAREIGYHVMADETLEIADDSADDFVEKKNKDGTVYTALDREHVQRSGLRVDTRKWLLSKALPKIYGQKTPISDDDSENVVVRVEGGLPE